MIKKRVGLLFGVLFIGIFFMSFSSGVLTLNGGECGIGTAAECSSYDVIVQMSGLTNAHGQIYDTVPEYDYALCCNSQGISSTRQCSGGNFANKVIGLSSSTNAHVENESLTNYPVNVCFGNFNCLTSDTNPDPIIYSAILSISSNTNAHVGSPGNYPLQIWCDVTYSGTYCGDGICGGLPEGDCTTPNDQNQIEECDDGNSDDTDSCSNSCTIQELAGEQFYWSETNEFGTSISGDIDVFVGTTKMYMVLEGYVGLNPGDEIYFEIYKEDLWTPDDKIRVDDNNITGVVSVSGKIIVEWTISQSDIDSINGDPDEIYFEATHKDGTIFVQNSDWSSEYIGFGSVSAIVCGVITICSNYGSENICNIDTSLSGCNVADFSVELNTETGFCDTVDCECYWKADNTCNSKWTSTDGGLCTYTETTESSCSAENLFITYTREALWSGDESDSLASECTSGSTVVPCPAKIQLPFFNAKNLIGALILIAVIYYLLSQNKGRKVKKKK